MRRFLQVCAALSLLAVLAAGCGPKGTDTVKVSGKVTMEGEPISMGTISFVAADGNTPSGGGVIKDGAYTAQVPPGEKVVLVIGNKHVGQEREFEDMPNSPMRDKYEQITPPSYNAAHETSLKASITGPKEGLDFALTKKGK